MPFSFMKLDKNMPDGMFFITLLIFGGEAMHFFDSLKLAFESLKAIKFVSISFLKLLNRMDCHRNSISVRTWTNVCIKTYVSFNWFIVSFGTMLGFSSFFKPNKANTFASSLSVFAFWFNPLAKCLNLNGATLYILNPNSCNLRSNSRWYLLVGS